MRGVGGAVLSVVWFYRSESKSLAAIHPKLLCSDLENLHIAHALSYEGKTTRGLSTTNGSCKDQQLQGSAGGYLF